MSLEETSGREKEMRWMEVVKGRFAATVNDSTTGVGGSNVGEGGRGSTWLGFRATSEGVNIEVEGDEGE